MSDRRKKGSYEVGYGKPPKEHQFPKGGPSPNPGGRPRKPSRSLTERQLMSDVLRILEEPVRVKRGNKIVTISGVEALIQQLKAKALTGHSISIHRLLTIYSEAITRLNRYHPQLRSVEKYETELAEDYQRRIPDHERIQLEFFSRQTRDLVGLHDKRRDPYLRRGRQEFRAHLARERDRAERGIVGAFIAVNPDGRVAIADPDQLDDASTVVVIDQLEQARLLGAIGYLGKISPEAVYEALSIGGRSYNELRELLDGYQIAYGIGCRDWEEVEGAAKSWGS